MASLLGIKQKDIALYLNTYKSVKRRYNEEVFNDIVVVDDYAHHPTEVKTVIDLSRQKYPDKEIVAVLIPHTYSRTKAFYKDFAKVLSNADKVYVADIYPARENKKDYLGISHKKILELLKNGEHISPKTIDKLYKHHNSVILFMSGTDPSWLMNPYKKGLGA